MARTKAPTTPSGGWRPGDVVVDITTVDHDLTRLSPAADNLYRIDEYAWLGQQAEALRSRAWSRVDAANLAEFLDDMADDKRQAVKSHLRVLLLHMLKMTHQPELRSGSWRSSIIAQQSQAADKISVSPGMRQYLPFMFADAYRVARLQAAAETSLDEAVFPVDNPWTLDEALAYVPPPPVPHPAETVGGKKRRR